MKKRRSRKNLLSYTEKYAEVLLYEATGGKIGSPNTQHVGTEPQIDGMQFSDKRALLDSLTRLLAIKHRIDPEQEESEFMSMREQLNDAGRKTSGGALDAADDDPESSDAI